jgi:predicted GNAT family N-acyltransferase
MTDNQALFRVLRVEWRTHQAEIMSIRTHVFIEEQGVPVTIENDGLDPQCRLLLAIDDGQGPIGTARLLPTGQVGRMAVLKPWRRHGVGSALLTEIVALARETGLPSLFLHGQLQALPFYEKHGFVAEGPVFEEAGILHRQMRYNVRIRP